MSTSFDFSHFPILETERLRLRQITHDDAQALVDMFTKPEMVRYVIEEANITTLPAATGFIDWLNSDAEGPNGMCWWGITLKGGDDRLIGTCGFHLWEKDHRRVDIGYNMDVPYWGQGYTTEAAHAVVRWCFENLDLHRVQADCTEGNIGSERVLEKVGFTLEGIWRENTFEHGRFVNIKQYGLLRREYLGNAP
jgi:ribosomal-protein-alanine N-acetyltransferase